jgi:5'-nucleotidase
MVRRCLLVLVTALLVIPGSAALAQDSTAAPRLRILVANDDGFQAPGLVALVDSLVTIADVVVAAPLSQQSGTGHGITFREPIKVTDFGNRYAIPWYAIDARPATCVRLALTTLLDSLPDLVVSGINTGDNVGVSAWLSGTVAAAREAALHGIPAIAVSAGLGQYQDYQIAAGYIRQLVEQLLADGTLKKRPLLNVNVPAGGPRGVKVSGMSLMLGTETYDDRLSPRGQRYFWDTWSPPEDDTLEGTDLYWYSRGYITVTPLKIDQTDTAVMKALGIRLEK